MMKRNAIVVCLLACMVMAIILAGGCGGGKPGTEAISYNRMITDSIRSGGGTSSYAVDGKEGRYIFLDVRSISEGSAKFVLTDPDGFEVFSTTARDYMPDRGNTDPVELGKDGIHTLTITASDDASPEYEFIVWDVDPLVIDGKEIQMDNLIRGKTDIPGQIVEYTLEAESGQSFSLDVRNISEGSVDFILTGPDGLEVFSTTARDYMPDRGNMEFTLDREGTYLLTLDPQNIATPQYEFVIWNVDPVVGGGEIRFDTLIRGKTEMPGQIVEYAFSATAGQNFYLDVRSISEGSGKFILTGPDGFEVFSTTAYDYMPDRGNTEFTLDRTGTYILTVNADGTATPQYEFVIWDVEPVVDGGQIQFGVPTRGKISMPSQVFEYTLAAAAGQSFSIHVQTVSEGSIDFILTDSHGFEVFSTTARDYMPDRGNTEFTLDKDGTYKLTLKPSGADTPQFEFIVNFHGNGEPVGQEPARGDTERDAYIVTGYGVDADNFTFDSEATTFEAGEQFSFVFYNIVPFGTTAFTLQILDGDGKEVLGEQPYPLDEMDVDFDTIDTITDVIWLNQPGEYMLACLLDGEVRATHKVTIK